MYSDAFTEYQLNISYCSPAVALHPLMSIKYQAFQSRSKCQRGLGVKILLELQTLCVHTLTLTLHVLVFIKICQSRYLHIIFTKPVNETNETFYGTYKM